MANEKITAMPVLTAGQLASGDLLTVVDISASNPDKNKQIAFSDAINSNTTEILRNNAGTIGGVSGVTSDGTNMTAGSDNLRATSPRVTTAIADANGNQILGLSPTASATQNLTIANSNGGTPIIGVTGPASNIDLIVGAKGSGRLLISNTGTMAVENGSPFLIRTWNQGQYVWSDNTSAENGSVDTRLIRDAAGVVRIGGASTIGTLLTGSQVTPRTTTTSPAANDSRRVYTNEGATASVTFNLPSAVANLTYTFYVQDADGLSVVAATGDTIRIAGSVSATGGNISSTTVGNSVTLVAINATEWVAISVVGTWTVT